MTDAEPLFIDTNVLVDANIAESPFHDKALEALRNAKRQGRPLWISCQVLREYAAVVTRPQAFSQPMSAEKTADRIRYFRNQFRVAVEDAATNDKLVKLITQYDVKGKQVHDANIVATMLVNGVTRLLTRNPRDFSRFASIIDVGTP